ncbi:TRAP transporter small permease [Roseovarius sp. SK2]|jgi:TRAP-type C4-dicarboxylate transport system permease small subunit|uniref:TRAP transporter small permease n=1 Tax=Roseovarius TaxID=74030 RepID=UPI000CDE0716|nr:MULTISPECIES: TRAP transporter small permease [Roseovarius]MDD9725395.1 TRAP transporter small permease [Roseovarius sp. SK2]
MSGLKTLMDSTEKLLAAACVLAFAVMLGLGVLTVWYRFVIQDSLSFPDELIRYLFVWLVALGTAIGLRRNIHAAIGVFVQRLPAPLMRGALVFSSLCVIGFLAVVFYTGWHAAESAASQISPAMQIPLIWLFAAAPAGAAFGILFTLEQLVKQATLPLADLSADDH